MPGLTFLWLQFGFCSALILVAGARLMACGDAIAHRTGLGGTWVGMALLATVTSLPELVSGATAVTQAAAPDIAVGDVLGSCVFNLAMIAFVEALQLHRSAFDRVGRSHLFAGAFSVACLGLVGTWLAAHRLPHAWAPPGWLLALLLTALYVVGMRTIFRLERRQPVDRGPGPDSMPSLRAAVIGYTLAGTVVVAAAIWLPFLAVQLAAAMGWSEGLVGTLLVALSTSLPELAVTVAAARSGALDLAIGNLLGSNLFNMVVLALDIMLMLPADLMARVSGAHMASVLSAIVMSAAVMLALAAPPRQRLLDAVSWTSAVLVLVFLINVWLQMQWTH